MLDQDTAIDHDSALHATGMDVARKVLTLARECGVAMELGDVQVESLIPADMPAEMSSEEFLTSFSQVLPDHFTFTPLPSCLPRIPLCIFSWCITSFPLPLAYRHHRELTAFCR